MIKRIGIFLILLISITSLHAKNMLEKYMVGEQYKDDIDTMETKIEMIVKAIQNGADYPWSPATIAHIVTMRYYVVVEDRDGIKIVLRNSGAETITIKYKDAGVESLKRLVTNVYASSDYEELLKYINAYTKKIAENKYEVK